MADAGILRRKGRLDGPHEAQRGGITTFAELQHANTGDLRQIIAVGGALPPSSLDSWPTQATYAARGDWQGLATYNRH